MSCNCNEVLDIEFEIVSKYKDDLDSSFIPTRADISSLYDLKCAKDTIVPSMYNIQQKFIGLSKIDNLKEVKSNVSNIVEKAMQEFPLTLDEMQELTNFYNIKPTLVSTGIKAKYPYKLNAKLYSRSGIPYHTWLILGNSVGIIDSTYYNSKNEGEINVMFINLSPFDILIKKGDKIAQIEFSKYILTKDDNVKNESRLGGFNSTGFKQTKNS